MQGVDLATIARRTPGFSGASLSNLLNEAAIGAARQGRDAISYEDIDAAVDRILVGLEKKSALQTLRRKELVAFHEAGHAVVGAMIPDYDMVCSMTLWENIVFSKKKGVWCAHISIVTYIFEFRNSCGACVPFVHRRCRRSQSFHALPVRAASPFSLPRMNGTKVRCTPSSISRPRLRWH